jgi:hypothetical protein
MKCTNKTTNRGKKQPLVEKHVRSGDQNLRLHVKTSTWRLEIWMAPTTVFSSC